MTFPMKDMKWFAKLELQDLFQACWNGFNKDLGT
jgi:hypothetical protein